jgi:hypothetical protein
MAGQLARAPPEIQGKWLPGETFDTNFTNYHEFFVAQIQDPRPETRVRLRPFTRPSAELL